MNKPMVVLLVGPSATGKTNVQSALVDNDINPVLIHTNREERESDIGEYRYRSIEEIRESVDLITYAVFGEYLIYAIDIKEIMQNNYNVLSIISAKVAIKLQKVFKDNNIDFITVYINTDSSERVTRLKERGETNESIKLRMDYENDDINYDLINPDIVKVPYDYKTDFNDLIDDILTAVFTKNLTVGKKYTVNENSKLSECYYGFDLGKGESVSKYVVKKDEFNSLTDNIVNKGTKTIISNSIAVLGIPKYTTPEYFEDSMDKLLDTLDIRNDLVEVSAIGTGINEKLITWYANKASYIYKIYPMFIPGIAKTIIEHSNIVIIFWDGKCRVTEDTIVNVINMGNKLFTIIPIDAASDDIVLEWLDGFECKDNYINI